ncbi:MAG: hypothetical protein MI861_11845, partial [Pirellulales bacterium]|nr:hypothetical protein [Pirellulales bacterium]
LRYVRAARQLGRPDVIILPGTKNTLGDLEWLGASGLAAQIKGFAERGGHVVGICGGYQMLGCQVDNPDGLESGIRQARGLGLLEVETTFETAKQTHQVKYRLTDDVIAPGARGGTVTGYEIHHGRTLTRSAWLVRTDSPGSGDAPRVDGAHTEDGRIWGCYLHGLFHNDRFRAAWLNHLGVPGGAATDASSEHLLQANLDRLADAFETHIDFDRLMEIIFGSSDLPEASHAE